MVPHRLHLVLLTCTLIFGWSLPCQAVTGDEASKYQGKDVSISTQKLELSQFFRLIAELANLNVVVHPDIHGSVTLEVRDVPWDHLLEIVLRQKNLMSVKEGTVLYIIPLSEAKTFFTRSR